ncbi:MAG TPA: hypothetical protein VK203_08530 [Nostocaceae cyanobacterium]|nr:hypothetical protein [Nostocaceae cyanobacterium]
MLEIEQTKKPSRIILRYQGVGLSMLRNVKNEQVKNKYSRSNKGYKPVFVTKVNSNSVLKTIHQEKTKIPNKSARAYQFVKCLWKTSEVVVEILWNG